MKVNKKTVSLLAMLAILSPLNSAFSQVEITNTDPLDIEGEWSTRPSQAQRMEKLRKDLQKKTNDMIDTKIESMRLKQEKELANQLGKALGGQLNTLDEVSTAQSSVSKKEIEELKEPKSLKLIPRIGFLSIQSDKIDFESKVNAGIMFESMVHDRVAVGVGFNFTSMKIMDAYSNFGGSYYNSGYSYNPYYTNPYYGYSSLYQEREISYRSGELELNGKFYISNKTRVKPFVGLGVAYNRSELKYNDNGNGYQYYYNSVQNELGGEKYTSSTFTGSVLAGAELSFTETFGLVLDLKLSKGLNGEHGTSREADSLYYNPDLERLEGIANEMSDATTTSIGLGMVVAF